MKIFKISLLILCFAFITNICIAEFPASPALVSMMEQVQKTYLQPRGTNFGEMSDKYSLVNLAILLGYGMQSQKLIANGNRHRVAAFESLKMDIYVLFEWLVNKKKVSTTMANRLVKMI